MKTVQILYKEHLQQVEVIQRNKMTWMLLDPLHIQVTFYGHLDENSAIVERDLAKTGAHAIRRTYDKKNNKTTTIYKRAV